MKMRKYFKVLNAKSFQAIENNIFKKQLVHKNRILFNLKPYHIPPPPYVVIKVFNYGGVGGSYNPLFCVFIQTPLYF